MARYEDRVRTAPATVRAVTVADAEAILDIYRPIVETTHISFEYAVPSIDEMQARIRTNRDALPWIAATGSNDEITGYAYAVPFRGRDAYRWSVEVSVYVRADAQRRGIARLLYDELFDRLRESGHATAVAVIALPNDASVALHERLGFRAAGTIRRAGFKHDRWIDIALFDRPIQDGPMPPGQPEAGEKAPR